jgi:methyl-accepting chemotaxis protein
MGFITGLSIRNRILGVFALVLLGFLGFGASSVSSLSTVQDKVRTMVEQATPAALQSLAISDKVKQAVAALGFHMLSKTAQDAAVVQEQIQQVDAMLAELSALRAISEDAASSDMLRQVTGRFAELKSLTPDMLELAGSDELNLKALGFANRNTNAVFREKLQQLSALIESERGFEPEFAPPALPPADPAQGFGADGLRAHAAAAVDALEQVSRARRELFYQLTTLRYRWLSLNNEVRLFLAFRAPQAVDNVATYKSAVLDTLEAVSAYRDGFTFEQEEAFDGFSADLEQFWAGLDQLIAIHQAEDWRQDAYLVKTRLSPLVSEISDLLGALAERQRDAMRAANAEVVAIYASERQTMLVSALLIALVLGVLAWLLSRSITRPLARAVEVADRVAHGDLDNRIDLSAADETGRLMRSLDAMQRDLARRIEADAAVAAANLRIRRALDGVGAAVTVSDSENVLIYMNPAARALFERIEQDWQRDFPGFQVDGLIGTRLSDYLADPQLASAYRARLSEETVIDGSVAGCRMRLVAGPVYDDEGGYQGRVTQWVDRTGELARLEQEQQRLQAEREIAAENLRVRIALDNVSSNVMMADPERRIVYLNRSARQLFHDAADDLRQALPAFDPDGLLGASIDLFHRDPGRIAHLLERLDGTHASEIKVGPRTLRIVANPVLDADGNRLGTAVEWADRTAEVAVEQEIDDLVDAARAGDLRRRIGLAGKQGFFGRLATGFNALLDELSGVFDEIARVMAVMADGDLEQRIRGEYRGTFGEVQGDINRTLDNLRDVIARLRDAAEEVGSAAEEINGGNQNLSSRTEQQASSLQETAASLEQLTATVRNNADNARQADQVAASARSAAQRGGEVVGEAVAAMEQINIASNRIAEIIGVIDEIAFQTNLLALNASVEAARAGEQGRGFAVVASEVRNLASRSAGAAKEIKELIRDSVDKVKAGSALVNQSGETLQDIVASVRKVGDIIAEISAASDEQSLGIEQVNRAVSSMDEMTQQNAALAEQTSAASQAMRDNASGMRELTAFFRTGRPPAQAAAGARPNPALQAEPIVAPAAPAAAARPTPLRAAALPTPARTAERPAPAAEEAWSDDEWEEF